VSERGFSLIEGLIALAILGIVLTALASAFITCLDANTRLEQRTAAVAVAQRTIETLRRQEPATLPEDGTTVAVVALDGRDYEVLTHFCRDADFCSDDTRHLEVEVSFGGRTIYAVETVFTALR
jgi:prepilin-type N-terminal cleavage/methylation domain-containing protein